MENKARFIILLITTIFLVLLITSVFIYGKGLSCEMCEIRFKSTTTTGFDTEFGVKLIDLYNNFTQDKCLVGLTKESGYFLN